MTQNLAFRGASVGREPGIHNPGAAEYGCRIRATQVGPSRLGLVQTPIPGKPEIGGAPRNDEHWAVVR